MTDAEDEQTMPAAASGIPGRQVCCHHAREGSEPLRYLLFLPAGYDDAAGNWPLMVFLHGAGERGDDLSLVKTYGPPMLVEKTANFPFVLVSPQCAAGRQWEPERLLALVEDVVSRHRIDRRRIVLTGVSLGGYGTWMTAASDPARFAALAPVCGWGDPAWAACLRDVPSWILHGEDDEVIPITRSFEMRDALLAAGADVRFTPFPGVGHDAWTQAYAMADLYDWLLHRVARGASPG